jgi:hypothetical protein
MSDKPSDLNEFLRQQLLVANDLDQHVITQNTSGTILEIPNTGKIVSSAYEQLRNAAEYAEEHLLLQRAIKRFFKRNLFVSKRQRHDLGLELIVDLTQAGYLQEGKFSETTSSALRKLIEQYMATHRRLRQAHIAHETADNWILALLSTEAENILNPHNIQQGTLLLAYNHFLQALPREYFIDLPDTDSYEQCLYIAIHQAVLKSDIDSIRCDLHRLYLQSPEDTAGFIRLSQRIDRLCSSKLTQALKRVVSRNGAPFRILKSLNDSRRDIIVLLPDKERFLEAYSQQINSEYHQLGKRLERGLIKSVVFIVITKLMIGVGVEIPYDLLFHGSIIILPLAVNLLFPPFYMLSLVLGLQLPSSANKHTIHNYMEQILYGVNESHLQLPKRRRATPGTRLAYALLFTIPLVITVLALDSIGFNIVQMIIFFIFFSTASFLGFRLSTMVRDLELTSRRVGLLGSLQDFFYLPFVTLGQWLSRKYSQINVIAQFMDIAIELPLKSMLRLLQQWVSFLRERHEELY